MERVRDLSDSQNERLRQLVSDLLRPKGDYTQAELAEKVGVTQPVICFMKERQGTSFRVAVGPEWSHKRYSARMPR